MPDLQELGEAIKRGDRDKSVALTQEAIDSKAAAQEILDVMVGAMDIVGQRFQKNEIFVPEMLIAARAMKEAMALLEPILGRSRDHSAGQGRHWNGGRRPARHRQESRCHDVERRKL